VPIAIPSRRKYPWPFKESTVGRSVASTSPSASIEKCRNVSRTGARVVTAPGQVLENATIVIRNGLITAVGANVRPPAGARVWELKGQTVYPGFIDAHADLAGCHAQDVGERGRRRITLPAMAQLADGELTTRELAAAGCDGERHIKQFILPFEFAIRGVGQHVRSDR
jgi:N-acetylglucosamine-6-phosphate deacetylase